MVHTVSDVNFHVPLLRSADLPFAPTLSALVNGTRIDVEGRTEPDAETLRTTFAIHTARCTWSISNATCPISRP